MKQSSQSATDSAQQIPVSRGLEAIISRNKALIAVQSSKFLADNNYGGSDKKTQVAHADHPRTPDEATQQAREHIAITADHFSQSLKGLSFPSQKQSKNRTFRRVVPNKDVSHRAFNIELGNKTFNEREILSLDVLHMLGLITASYSRVDFSIIGVHVVLK
jgi:hypothetical protein